jgi:hypothetical protein
MFYFFSWFVTKPIFKLVHVWFLVAHFMKFVVLVFNVSLLTLNHLFRLENTSLMEF